VIGSGVWRVRPSESNCHKPARTTSWHTVTGTRARRVWLAGSALPSSMLFGFFEEESNFDRYCN
jgi:hypothetical protein